MRTEKRIAEQDIIILDLKTQLNVSMPRLESKIKDNEKKNEELEQSKK
jgi:hypothetical protein